MGQQPGPSPHRLRRRIAWGAAIFGLCVVMAGMAGLLWLRHGLPGRPAQVTVPGLAAPASIGWDGDGVPHIQAGSETDAALVLGWVHARDRLWQMEQQRRAAAGRLAELFGPAVVDIDKLFHLLDVPGRAARSVAALNPETRAIIDAYVRGVNLWLATHKGPFPPEFLLLGHAPEPWTAADVLGWGQLIAVQLSGDFREELNRAAIASRLNAPQRALLWGLDSPEAVSLPDIGQATPSTVDWPRLASAMPPALGPALASNVWVLGGQHTANGQPLLVNDPHLGLQAPSLWYLARWTTPAGTLGGATVPGVPFMVLGHNDVAAWGMTTTGADAQDLFIEQLDPNDPNRYLTPDGAQPFTVRTQTIRIKGQPDQVLTIRTTRHGPVISDINAAAAKAAGPGQVVALGFTALQETSRTADALYGLNRARTWEDLYAALRHWDAPQQNVAWAHTDGTIAMISPGLLPVRRHGDGLLPVEGWTDRHDWLRAIPFDVLPAVVNPASGLIINANNRLVGEHYPHLLTKSWAEDHRARRIAQMLAGAPPQTMDTAQVMLGDTLSLDAVALLPVLLQAESQHPLAAPALEMLRSWDGRMLADQTAPLIYSWWLRSVTAGLLLDELGGPANARALQFNATAIERILLRDGGAWCDDITTANQQEPCSQIVSAALTTALEALTERHGRDPAKWLWGAEHSAALEHQIFSRIPGLAQLTDLSVPSDGGYYTVNRGASRLTDDTAPFRNGHGAGYRAIYDLGALDKTRVMLSTGQSGHPLSRHWGDFVARWAAGQMRPLHAPPRRITQLQPG